MMHIFQKMLVEDELADPPAKKARVVIEEDNADINLELQANASLNEFEQLENRVEEKSTANDKSSEEFDENLTQEDWKRKYEILQSLSELKLTKLRVDIHNLENELKEFEDYLKTV